MTDSGYAPIEPRQNASNSPSDHIASASGETPASDVVPPQQAPQPEPQPEWYYAVNGQSFGPVTRPQLVTLAQARYFGPDDFVYAAYLGNWVRAGSVHGLFDSVAPFPAGPEIAPPLYVPGHQAPFGPEVRTDFAGFWGRWLSAFIDGFVLMFPLCIVILIGTTILERSGHSIDRLTYSYQGDAAAFYLAAGVFHGSVILLMWPYYALLESSPWRATLGKRAVGIIVTDIYGKRISFPRASGRYFASWLSSFWYIGYLIQPFTGRRQAFHDLIAGTVVLSGRM